MTQAHSPNAQAAMIRFAAANQESAAANVLSQDPAFRSSVSTTISRWTADHQPSTWRKPPCRVPKSLAIQGCLALDQT